ncbi:hypothetical protein B0H14DRAFT_3468421 [Mycena olivaceomarginata]|nr:hypothetical protein B0H14DRAFT_3468421 [Mycena olivaceomarginata]
MVAPSLHVFSPGSGDAPRLSRTISSPRFPARRLSQQASARTSRSKSHDGSSRGSVHSLTMSFGPVLLAYAVHMQRASKTQHEACRLNTLPFPSLSARGRYHSPL